MAIREERPGDEGAIGHVTAAAFAGHPHSDGREPAIFERLRVGGDLALSLVAKQDGAIVGHVAFSPALLSNGEGGWFVLGPLSVVPERQGQGIGRALVEAAVARLRARGARGVVLIGEPALYARFGFVPAAPLRLEGPAGDYLQALAFAPVPEAELRFAPAFGP